jgi:hypothetical protein
MRVSEDTGQTRTLIRFMDVAVLLFQEPKILTVLLSQILEVVHALVSANLLGPFGLQYMLPESNPSLSSAV